MHQIAKRLCDRLADPDPAHPRRTIGDSLVEILIQRSLAGDMDAARLIFEFTDGFDPATVSAFDDDAES